MLVNLARACVWGDIVPLTTPASCCVQKKVVCGFLCFARSLPSCSHISKQDKWSLYSKMQANYERKILCLGSEIGCGSYGRVFEATLGNKPVAVKVLHDSLLDSKDFKLIVDKFRKECELLQRLNHKNVVKLIQYSISYSSNSFLITELLACDLGKYITSLQPGKITFPEVVSIMLDVAQGLHYLHYECNPAIVHRDLASKNILLTKTRQAKIADVGIAKFFPRKQSKMFASPVPGTPLYLAPETWPHQETTETAATLPDVAYNEKIDIFSFGVVLMEAINGREPKCYPAAFDTGAYTTIMIYCNIVCTH